MPDDQVLSMGGKKMSARMMQTPNPYDQLGDDQTPKTESI